MNRDARSAEVGVLAGPLGDVALPDASMDVAGLERPMAWIATADAGMARALARELMHRGWRIGLVTTRLVDVMHALSAASDDAQPQLLISGLRFGDGDAFGLMRHISQGRQAPALALVSHQQRAVLRAAQALADTYRLRLAGVTELPCALVDIVDRAEVAVRAHGSVLPPSRVTLPPLDRLQLQALLDAGGIRPFFQPKMRMDTHEVIGFEALMRGVDGQGRLITPDRLIAPLLEHGLLGPATLRIAHHTVEFVAACLRQGMGISASINVSLSLMSDTLFCSALQSLVHSSGVDPSWITLEITETEAMADLATVIEQTGRIRMLGFNLSIDDFGTAYSSFTQLAQIPFSELKIERAFVQDMHLDPTKRAIVGACALLGREMGLSVVAEGVETPAELRGVEQAGVGMAQGFLIARPMPAAQAVAWLADLHEERNAPEVRVSRFEAEG